MHHRVACLVLWGLSVLALHSQALSQEVRIVKKPLPAGYQYDQWAVSHSQKNVPDAFLADGIWSSEEKAMAVVNRLKNARRTGDGFDIAIILVEVSGSPIGEGKAAKLVKDAKEVTKIAKLTAKAKKIADEGAAALAKERKIGSTLRDYVKQTQGAYKRAAEAKKELTSSTGKVSRQVFDKVNNQIAEYNRMRDAAVTMSSQLAAAKDERVAIDLELKSAQKKLRKADPDAVTDDAGIDDETSDDSSSLLNSLPALAALTAAELGDRLEATAPSKTSPEEDILSLREKALEKSKLDAKMSAKRETANNKDVTEPRKMEKTTSDKDVAGKWYVRIPEYTIGRSGFGGFDYVYILNADGTWKKAFLEGTTEKWDDTYPLVRGGTWEKSTSEPGIIYLNAPKYSPEKLLWRDGFLKLEDRTDHWFIMVRQK